MLAGLCVEIRYLSCEPCDRRILQPVLYSLLPETLLCLCEEQLLQTLQRHLVHVFRRRRAHVRDYVDAKVPEDAGGLAKVVACLF
jgi:hypothetical protein